MFVPSVDILNSQDWPKFYGWPNIAYYYVVDPIHSPGWDSSAVYYDLVWALTVVIAVGMLVEWRARAARFIPLHRITLAVLLVASLPLFWLNTRMQKNLGRIEYHDFRQRPYDGKKLGEDEYEWYGWPAPSINYDGFSIVNLAEDGAIAILWLATVGAAAEFTVRRRSRMHSGLIRFR